MKPVLFALSIALFSFSKTNAQMQWVFGENPNWLWIADPGLPTIYPSVVTITGGHPYIAAVEVTFPSFFYENGSFRGYDLMLESPVGTRMMLLSDTEFPHGGALISSLTFSSLASRKFSAYYSDPAAKFLPVNLGATPDSFPFPGPGLIAPMESRFADFVNEDPNGNWKLWVADDTLDGTYFTLDQGWKLSILTSPVPVCVHPELPVATAITDSTATVSWSGNGPATHWDVLFGPSFMPDPGPNTPPSFSNWPANSMNFQQLGAGEHFKFFIRAACDDGTRGLWIGPVEFITLFTPCLHANPVGLCEWAFCDSVRSFLDFPYPTNCGPGAEWVFRFTAPQTGAYWLELQNASFGDQFYTYLLPDTTADCPTSGWECGILGPTGSFNKILDSLEGGTSYFLMFGYCSVPPIFRLSRCPAMGISIKDGANPDLEPFTATILFEGINNILPLELDLFYTKDSTVIPGNDTPPSETGVALNTQADQYYHLTTDTLQASSTYQIWLRSHCDSGAEISCWEGPFFFHTGTDCGGVDSVWFDQVTEHEARLNLIAPVGFTYYNWRARLIGSPVGFWQPIGSVASILPGEHLTDDLYDLHQDTTYEVFVQAYCVPSGGANPWSGPYLLKTKPGCLAPVDDIQCGQVVGAYFDSQLSNLFGSTSCYGNDYTNLNEKLFRFKAEKTGDISLSCPGWNNTQIHWFYKDAALGCGSAGFVSAGCTAGSAFSGLTFPVDSGTTYYLLADGFWWNTTQQPYFITFEISGCGAPVCSPVNSVWVDAKTTTTATLRWRNTTPGATYEVYARPSLYFYYGPTPEEVLVTTDTTITFTGLGQSLDYFFWVNTICSGVGTAFGTSTLVSLGEHVVKRGYSLGRCSPRFVPSGEVLQVPYEVFDLEVPLTGDYLLNSAYYKSYLYGGLFDPENPATNLLATFIIKPPLGADTVLALQTGITYKWVVADMRGYPDANFNVKGDDFHDVFADGPVPVSLLTPEWDGRTPAPHGLVPYLGAWFHSGVCADTAGWVHYYKIADDPSDRDGDRLLLSVKTTVPAAQMNALPMVFSSFPGPVKITSPPAIFFQNPDGIYEMNRIWLMQDLLPAQQIDQDFTVRFYYTQQEYEQLKAVIEANGGNLDSHEAMFFYKINGFHGYSNVSPWEQHIFVPAAVAYDSSGYWPYENGPEASSSTWRHGTFAGEHFSEIVIHGFSGGGGGASVNGRSIFDPISKTTDIVFASNLKLSPNPNTGTFTIELPKSAAAEMTLRIVGLTGQLVREQPTRSDSRIQTVQAGDLPAGLYFLQVVADGKVLAVEKFVKQ